MEQSFGPIVMEGNRVRNTTLKSGVWGGARGLWSSKGRLRFGINVQQSAGNDGGAMLLGVVERKGDGSMGTAWVLYPYWGKLYSIPDACKWEGFRNGAKLMEGDLRGVASGAHVEVLADLIKHELWVKVKTTKSEGTWMQVLARHVQCRGWLWRT